MNDIHHDLHMTVGDASEDIIVQMDTLLEQMKIAARLAEAQSSFIKTLTYGEAIAGIWEKPPDDENAVADTNGLYLNCVNSGLYMVVSLCLYSTILNQSLLLDLHCWYIKILFAQFLNK